MNFRGRLRLLALTITTLQILGAVMFFQSDTRGLTQASARASERGSVDGRDPGSHEVEDRADHHRGYLSRKPTAPTTAATKLSHIRTGGRLGNAMFEYAATLGMAAQLGLSAELPGEFTPWLAAFSPRLPISLLDATAWARHHAAVTVVESDASCCRWDRAAVDAVRGAARVGRHVLWSGFTQSYRYFAPWADRVRRDLAPGPGLRAEVDEFLMMAAVDADDGRIGRGGGVGGGTVFIGVHIRRGDYTRLAEPGFTLVTDGYVAGAMLHMARLHAATGTGGPIVFVVASDDMQWSRAACDRAAEAAARASNVQARLVYSPWPDRPEADMALLSSCNHTIMSTGTFGWWAAYLSAGHVVYYSEYARPGSHRDREIDPADFFPEEWTPVSPAGEPLQPRWSSQPRKTAL